MNQTQSFLQFAQTRKAGLNVMIRIEDGRLVVTQYLPLYLSAEINRKTDECNEDLGAGLEGKR